MPKPAIRRALPRTSALLLLLASAACGRDGHAARPQHPERLDGAWSMEFRVEHPITAPATPPAPVRGSVLLMENAPAAPAVPARDTHYGAYTGDLSALGVTPAAGVPTLVARMAGADSVQFTVDGGTARPLHARGRLYGDSVAGHWWTDGGRVAGGSSGRFVLRRP